MEARQLFAIDGLFCGGCASGLETKLQRLHGVLDAKVHFVTASALLRWDPAQCDLGSIDTCVSDAGYKLIERHDLSKTAAWLAAAKRRLAKRLAVAAFFGMWTMAAALVLYVQPDLDRTAAWWIALASGVLVAPAIGFAGASLLRMGFQSLRMRVASIDLLLMISVASAIILSIINLSRGRSDVYFDAASMLITLRLLGQVAEAHVRSDAIRALQAMEELTPELAQRVSGGAPVPLSMIAVSDCVTVDAGGAVTVDGIVQAGSSAVDRSLLTGEAHPQPIGPGDRVQAGTLNLSRQLTICVDREPGDRDIDRMGGRVALEIAARGERGGAVDRFVDWLIRLTPVLTSAGLVATWAHTGSLTEAAATALAIALVICPCALTIARPLAMLRAVEAGARLGLRIGDPAALDALAEVRTVIFDKTGTITSGAMAIATVNAAENYEDEEVLAYAARAETGIEHPIARAIVEKAGAIGPGGVREARAALADDMEGRQIRVTGTLIDNAESGTSVGVWLDDRQIGSLTFADTLDVRACDTIDWLRHRGVRLMLATGDGLAAAQLAATTVGLAESEVAAGCTPGEKADLVNRSPRPVLFVGDGINDAPALAAADIGMTVARAHGIATANGAIAIVNGGLERVVTAIRLARRSRGLLRENLWLSVGYNVVFVPAAMIGTLSPVMAAIAMTASSMLVVVNTYRLR